MKIQLLKSIDKIGIILDLEKIMRDAIEVRCEEDGTLILSCANMGERAFPIKNGNARIFDIYVAQGPNKVSFVDSKGVNYNLGVLYKNNRFLTVQNPLDEITVKLALGLEAEKVRADKLEKRFEALEKEFGINVLEV